MAAKDTAARVTVVGTVWIIVGLLSAQLAVVFIVLSLTSPMDSFGRGTALGGITLFTSTAVVGIVAAIGLLRRRRWSRLVLEVLTWGYCAICLAASVFGVYGFVTWTDSSDLWVPAISMIGYPLALAVFGSILWALRSGRMREALVGAA